MSWKQIENIGYTSNTPITIPENINPNEILVIVKNSQVKMYIDNRFCDESNNISGALSSYGNSTYWTRLSCTYNVQTKILNAYYADYEGVKTNLIFKAFYR